MSSTASACSKCSRLMCIFCKHKVWNRIGKRLIINCMSNSISTFLPAFSCCNNSSILALTAACTSFRCSWTSPLKTACVICPLENRRRLVDVTSVTTAHLNQFRLPVSSSEITGVAPVLSGLNENPRSIHCIVSSIDDRRAILLCICCAGAQRQAKAYCAPCSASAAQA